MEPAGSIVACGPVGKVNNEYGGISGFLCIVTVETNDTSLPWTGMVISGIFVNLCLGDGAAPRSCSFPFTVARAMQSEKTSVGDNDGADYTTPS